MTHLRGGQIELYDVKLRGADKIGNILTSIQDVQLSEFGISAVSNIISINMCVMHSHST